MDIGEPLLRKARSKAALDGIRMTDVINHALKLYLEGEDCLSKVEQNLPAGIHLETHGQFKLPMIRSNSSDEANVSPQNLKDAEITDDLERHAKVFGR